MLKRHVHTRKKKNKCSREKMTHKIRNISLTFADNRSYRCSLAFGITQAQSHTRTCTHTHLHTHSHTSLGSNEFSDMITDHHHHTCTHIALTSGDGRPCRRHPLADQCRATAASARSQTMTSLTAAGATPPQDQNAEIGK